MRQIDCEERRKRLVTRHLLAEPADDPVEVARSMVGLHSSDPATVFLSVWARMDGFTQDHLERALYDDRSLVRILGMRRTVWVVPTEFAPAVNSSSTAALARPQFRRLARMVEESGLVEDGEPWLTDVLDRTEQALESKGTAMATDLKDDVPELAEQMVFYKKDGSLLAKVGMSTRALFQLAAEARVVRGRPQGSWLSSQYSWATMSNWLGQPLEELPRNEAQDEVIVRWLWAFGPGTEADLKWWTGWPVTQVRKSLERVKAREVALDRGTGWVLAEDTELVEEPRPSVALLPSLDPTTMGWKERSWYLGDYGERLFDRTGNAGPTIWVDGRVVGGWAQLDSSEIVHELFEDVGRDAGAEVESLAAGLETWLDGTTVTPRFRSSHEKQLANR